MTDSDDRLPEGWTRAEDSDERAGQYNAQQPIRYRREGLEIDLLPATNAAGADADVWRLILIGEGHDASDPLREGIEGRDSAIGLAREFMETYNERHIAGDEPEDDVIASF